MKTISRNIFRVVLSLAAGLSFTGCHSPEISRRNDQLRVRAGEVAIVAAPDRPKPPYQFAPDDEQLLDEIQHATFNFFWKSVSDETGMVYDRTSSDVISIAGVGFQLAALPIGVERGWVTRDQARKRAMLIITALENEPSNRKAGLFYHFINPHDASARRVGRELVVSTIDSAILFSGMLVAGQYFDGDVAAITDRLFADADWSFFLDTPGSGAPPGAFLSLGWKPQSDTDPTGDGELLHFYWLDSGDEHRLVTFLASCAPNLENRIHTSVYWNLRRQLGWHDGQGYTVWFPYSGALFTAFFAHCFINYTDLTLDDPQAHGALHRPRVDWWENSRRLVNLHRDRAIANPLELPTLGPNAWGLSACDGPDGYLVPGFFPTPVEMIGATPGQDYSTYAPEENWGGGVIPPYAAGASIMFEPQLALKALRHYRTLEPAADLPTVWSGSPPDGQGFTDSFRLDASGTIDWVASDFVAISQGPLLLGIENARSGLIWRLFMAHPAIEQGKVRLGLKSRP